MRKFRNEDDAIINVSAFKLAAIECTKEFMTFVSHYQQAMNAAHELDKYMAGKTIENVVNEDSCETLVSKKEYHLQIAAAKLFDLDKAFAKKEHQHIVLAYIEKDEYELLMDYIDRVVCQ